MSRGLPPPFWGSVQQRPAVYSTPNAVEDNEEEHRATGASTDDPLKAIPLHSFNKLRAYTLGRSYSLNHRLDVDVAAFITGIT